VTIEVRNVRATVLVLTLLAGGGNGCARSSTAPPASASPVAPTAPAPAAAALPPTYEVRSGRDVYRHYCQTCHGETGAGDGFNAFNLDPHPRDFSDPAFQKKTDADIRDAIRRGGAGVGLSPLMPPWGRTLGDRKLDDVVLYLRTLRRQPPS
jgi:mono/diheme cytochrome c family protein